MRVARAEDSLTSTDREDEMSANERQAIIAARGWRAAAVLAALVAGAALAFVIAYWTWQVIAPAPLYIPPAQSADPGNTRCSHASAYVCSYVLLCSLCAERSRDFGMAVVARCSLRQSDQGCGLPSSVRSVG